jgi:hypothetical protein
MTIGSLVFHKFDPVRLFIRNPLSRGSSDPNKDQWTCEFTGYLDTKPYSQNYINGQSVINISCQDIRLLMSTMRVQTNPMATVANENTLFFDGKKNKPAKEDATSGFFNDLLTNDGGVKRTHVLAARTFVDSIKFLLFGIQRNGATARNGQVGKLTEGITKRFDPSDGNRETLLEEWNNLIVFGATPLPSSADAAALTPEGATTDVDGNPLTVDTTAFEQFPFGQAAQQGKLAIRGTFLTQTEMLSLGATTVWEGNGSPDNARVHFLLPASTAPLNNLVEFTSSDSRFDTRVEFVSRLDLLNQMCKSIDYQMYVTGIGDIVFEFPMYDFLPEDFNQMYENLYTVRDHLISDNINDEGGQPISALEVLSRTQRVELQGGADLGGAQERDGFGNSSELRRTIFSNVLASRIGIHVETHSIPGIVDQDKLTQYAYIEFNKRIANYNQFEMTSTFRPYIGVNRPIYHVRKERIGITSGASYTWNIRQDVSLGMSLRYPRKLEGDKMRFITGGQKTPMSYNAIFDNDIRVVGQGLSHNPVSSGENKIKELDEKNTGKREADKASGN